MNETMKVISIIILIIITISSGVWLHHLGRPINNIIFTLHKLLALGTIIYAIINLFKRVRGIELTVAWVILLAITALTVVTIVVTGALLSQNSVHQQLLLTIHNTFTLIILLQGGIIIYYLNK